MSPSLGAFRCVSWFGVSAALLVSTLAGAREHRRAGAASLARDDANDDRQACQLAFADARQQAGRGHLQKANRLFSQCADPVCGRALANECAARRAQLEPDIPSVVPVLTDREGRPVVEAAVSIDGQPLAAQLDGRAVFVDPGLHEFTFTADGQVVVTEALIAQGQRNYLVTASLQEPPADSQSEPKRRVIAAATDDDEQDAPLPPTARKRSSRTSPSSPSISSSSSSNAALYLLGGLGAAGLGGYGALVTWARNDNRLLLDCSPNCSPASVAHIRKLYLAADISLGVGLASLAATTWIYIATRPTRKESAYSFDFRLTPSGAMAAWGGRF
ncbi:MAG: hypothetical protein QOI66_2750 [Myxococcales bacterium]|jgi:hypothetical protein|nr:hypothetical protein [Myxococcales bacterium]